MVTKVKRLILKILKSTRYREGDSYLKIITACIIVFGLIMLASASSIISYETSGDAYYFFKRQLIFFIMGGGLFWLASKVDYHYFKKHAFVLLAISIGLLIIVFIPSLMHQVGGAKSWIEFSGFTLQPSEFVKLTFIIYLSAWFAGKKEKHHVADASQKSRPFFIILAIVALLMVLQPDIGTLFIVAISSLSVYFVGGGKVKHIIVICLVGIILMGAMLAVFDYQRERFKCLIDPGYSPQDKCYQVNQSLIAIGSGGFLGRGLGESRQKYLYLPEVQNDFVFSIIAEEMGFLFAIAIIALFLILFYRGYIIAKNTSDNFGKNLSIGIVTWLAIQAILNIGGIMNFLPMTGVPLPLISYGGSAVLSCMIALGILNNVSKYSK
ncbi:MAG: putative lipid II flippase FtsW [bacterium]